MKIRKSIALMLILCLTLAAQPALAIPCRELQAMDVMLDERLQALVEIAVAAAADDNPETLKEGETPTAKMAERALVWAAMTTEQTDKLSPEAAGRLYSQLFTQGEYTLPEASATGFATVTPQGLSFDPARLTGGMGVNIYSAVFDGTDVVVKGDVFTAQDGDVSSVEDLPEDAAQWAMHADFTLRYAPEKDFGYTISAVRLSPSYEAGDLSAWRELENTDYEYSVNLPAGYFHAIDDPQHIQWTWRNAFDETSVLTIDVTEEESQDYDRTLAEFLRAHPDRTVTQQRDFNCFYSLGEGEYDLWIVASSLTWAYHLNLTFPLERAEEFGLYCEFIRNSMIVWGLSNG